MAEFIEESNGLESTTIDISRTSATVKGGRRFSFGAFVVVGDRNGTIGLGYGKAPGVPAAIEKAQKNAKKNIVKLTLQAGTIPHQISGKYLASKIRLIPASPGTGVIAGGTVRAVLEIAGIRDCLTKSFGSNNKKNLAKATLEGLLALRSKKEVEALRGVDLGESRVDEILKLGEKFAPTVPVEPKAETKSQPKNKKNAKPQPAQPAQAPDATATATATAEPEKPAADTNTPDAKDDAGSEQAKD